MKRQFASAMAILAAGLLLLGCTQAPPAPTPTRAPAAPTKAAEPTRPAEPTKPPAAPTKAAEPTKAAAPAPPTAAPAKKVDFPAKGRAITGIVTFAPGGSTDLAARLLAPLMEKELGVPIEIVNKPGGGTQVGMTALRQAKPDGYTIGFTSSDYVTAYLDPESKATYTGKDFEALARVVSNPMTIFVKSDSAYKTLKDLVDAAKASPGKITVSLAGMLSVNHLMLLALEKAANVKFAAVQFDGGGPATTALLGGHVEAATISVSGQLLQYVQSGQVRVLGVADDRESKFLPGLPTFESQGYKVYRSTTVILAVVAETPPEIVQILRSAIKKAAESEELKTKFAASQMDVRYLEGAELATFLTNLDTEVKPLIQLAR